MEYWPDTLGYRIDFFTIFILLGMVQGFFLAIFVLLGKNRTYQYFGAILFAAALIMTEIFLCYSGVIVHIPHFVDLSEPFNFFIPAAIYLMVTALVGKHPKHWYWHFLPFGFYFLYHFNFFLQDEVFKLNAFRNAYHDYLPELPNHQTFHADPWCIKEYVNELGVLQSLLYVWPIYQLVAHFLKAQKDFWTTIFVPAYRWFFAFLFLKVLGTTLWLFKVLLDVGDAWDNIGAAFDTFTIYALNFFILKDGVLQKGNQPEKKYQKSALSQAQMKAILWKLTTEMEQEQPYLNPKLTLKKLAERINVSPHHLSQVLNEQLNKTYYEWIAAYRVAAAKDLMIAQKHIHYKLEEIGTLAGFNSRSVFYKAFKKIEGVAPSAFRDKLK